MNKHHASHQAPACQPWPGTTIACRGPVLHRATTPCAEGYTLQYGIGSCLQVSPTQAVMLLNRRVTDIAVGDFECGWDTLLFDRVEAIGPDHVQPGLSNTDAVHPRTGRPLTLVHHLPQGGFVPLGARLANGAPPRRSRSTRRPTARSSWQATRTGRSSTTATAAS